MTKLQKFGLVFALACFVSLMVFGAMLPSTTRVWKGEEATIVGGPGYERGELLVSVMPIETGRKPRPESWFVKASCPNPWLKKGDKVRLYTKQIWGKPVAFVGEVF
ncbi:MAG: hypothetical protein AAB455_02815 [Patescibacteria group bacterium]